MTANEAHRKALRLSKKFDTREYFVVEECGEYDVCREFDLDTFYNGVDAEACYIGGERA